MIDLGGRIGRRPVVVLTRQNVLQYVNKVLDMYGDLPYSNWSSISEGTMLRTDKDTAGKGPRAERLEARVTKEQKALFVRAAELQGRSLTDFLVASAQAAAMETVRTHDAMRLSERDREAFVSALLTPPSPARTLEQAAKRYRQRMGR